MFNKKTFFYRVAASPDCKMPISNLSRVFGPTIVGYSNEGSENLYYDCELSNKVSEKSFLLTIINFLTMCTFTGRGRNVKAVT